MTVTNWPIQPMAAVTRLVTAVVKSVMLKAGVVVKIILSYLCKVKMDYRRMIRRIRPTPRPTNERTTNANKSGWPVITPTKEVTQLMAPVTRAVMAVIIASMVLYPLSKNSSEHDTLCQRDHKREDGQASKSRNWLRKKELRELGQKPCTEIHHRLHSKDPPNRKTQ